MSMHKASLWCNTDIRELGTASINYHVTVHLLPGRVPLIKQVAHRLAGIYLTAVLCASQPEVYVRMGGHLLASGYFCSKPLRMTSVQVWP